MTGKRNRSKSVSERSEYNLRPRIRLHSLRRNNPKMAEGEDDNATRQLKVTLQIESDAVPLFRGNRKPGETDFVSNNVKLHDWIIALESYFLNNNVEDCEKRNTMYKFIDKQRGDASFLLGTFLHPTYNDKSWEYIKSMILSTYPRGDERDYRTAIAGLLLEKKVNEEANVHINIKTVRDCNYTLKELFFEKTELDRKKKMDLEDAFELIVSNLTMCIHFNSNVCEEVFKGSMELNIEECFRTMTTKVNKIPVEKGLYPKRKESVTDEARGMFSTPGYSGNQNYRGGRGRGGNTRGSSSRQQYKGGKNLNPPQWEREEMPGDKGRQESNHSKRFDKKKVKCHNCGKMGHFRKECRHPKIQGNEHNWRGASGCERELAGEWDS